LLSCSKKEDERASVPLSEDEEKEKEKNSMET
jgi:hypothetical protein